MKKIFFFKIELVSQISLKWVLFLYIAIFHISLSVFFESISVGFLRPWENLGFLFRRMKRADHLWPINLFGLTLWHFIIKLVFETKNIWGLHRKIQIFFFKFFCTFLLGKSQLAMMVPAFPSREWTLWFSNASNVSFSLLRHLLHSFHHLF